MSPPRLSDRNAMRPTTCDPSHRRRATGGGRFSASAASRRAYAAAVLLAAALAYAPAAAAQRDTTAVAGLRYRAGGTGRWLLGSTYRDLWTAPFRVPVLDLGSYAGGLTPTKLGSGNQTASLHFRSGDGREFAFRSVDKDQTRTLPKDLQGTVVASVFQDQISSLVPAAGVVSHPIEHAAGLSHTTEQLFVMPDDPRLGEFRQQFAGMLGTLEERPKVGDTVLPGLAGADAIEDTDTMLAALESGPGERFDGPGYLAARLVDILVGDWDRHGGQYDWRRFPVAGGHVWRVLPRDRDYAFVDYDGLLPQLAHSAIANAARYRGRIELHPMLVNAAPIDHRLLGAVDRAAWDSVTRAVHASLSDAAIDAAVAQLPPEWRRLEGAQLAQILKQRRDDLPRASDELYHIIALEAEPHGTDVAEDAEIDRLPDGHVRVTIAPLAGGGTEYDRTFDPAETREVRVYLHGGDDHARVTGSGPERMIVRVIGGAGDDDLRDEGRAGHRTAFYDESGHNTYARRPHTKVDERPWKTVKWVPGGGTTPPRDWGGSSSLVSPTGGWGPGGAGLYLGVGPKWTRYGFRREPYAATQQIKLMWLVAATRFGAEYTGDFRYVGRPMDRTLALARASEMEATRFFGFGNDTQTGGLPSTHFRVFERQLLADGEHWHGIGRQAWLVLGATARYSDAQPVPGAPAFDLSPRGSGSFLIGGGRAGLVFHRTDSTEYHRSGWTLNVVGDGYPLATHEASAFGSARGVGTAYLSAGAGGPTLALRAGGARVWGGFPFQYAALVGGGRSLRGYASQRFAGDASAFGNAELRQVLTRAKLIVHGDLGVLGMGDAGRVWYRGASPGGWHTAYGGGLFFTFLDRKRAVSATYVSGEKSTVYFTFGMPF